MELKEFWRSVQGAASLSHTDKIKLFAWHLHTYRNIEYFTPTQIKNCFNELSLDGPTSVHPFLSALQAKKPKEVLEHKQGFRLEARIKDKFDEIYGARPATVIVHRLLAELPAKLPATVERVYLEEAIICFRNAAYRASVVMCWNLAFDHLCDWVLKGHLAAFNAQLPRSFPRADISAIVKRDDFTELKESQVLQVCSSAGIITGSVHKILKEKLDRRNIAAHPSGVSISQLTAEEYIKDLVDNVILKLV